MKKTHLATDIQPSPNGGAIIVTIEKVEPGDQPAVKPARKPRPFFAVLSLIFLAGGLVWCLYLLAVNLFLAALAFVCVCVPSAFGLLYEFGGGRDSLDNE